MKITSIVGARPQFMKYFPISKAIEAAQKQSSRLFQDVLIHTGQHYDYNMSSVFFEELGIKEPDHHLGIGSGSHGRQTGQMLEKIEEALLLEKPDVVIVYGDTNSTLAGALAASKLHIPLAHVEAGLRSFNKYMPEEINRVETDHVSSVLFCPSKRAVENLSNEGFKNMLSEGNLISVDPQKLRIDIDRPLVANVGDVMYDMLLLSVQLALERSSIVKRLGVESQEYILLTLHRAENTDHPQKLEEIVRFVNQVSAGHPVIFPMHPRTRKIYESHPFGTHVKTIDPVGYFDNLMLLKNSALLLTDSGGMQKESYWLEVPCITLREETEWTETVESGWNVLYRDYTGEHSPSSSPQCYGDGKAAERIVATICGNGPKIEQSF